MWATLFLCSLVGHSAVHGWKSGEEYRYSIDARTVAGMYQMANQYVGTLIRGKLIVNAQSGNLLTLQVQGAEYADLNQNLNEGWDTQIHEGQVPFKKFPIRNQPFQIYMNDGVFQKMVVDKDLSFWELNFLKGITSQFQVNALAKNVTRSKLNDLPHGDQVTGVFVTMEESINGKYETIHEISLLPDYLLMSSPQLAPLEYLRGDGELYRIFKTRNFSNSEQHVVYRYGMNGHEGWEAGTNTMGNFLARSSESAIIISGKPENYTIQSTVTTEKVLVAPHLYGSQKGIVACRMNLTLEEVTVPVDSVPSINNSRTVKSLVYEFEHKTSETPYSPFESIPFSESNSDSDEGNNRPKRKIRSLRLTEKKAQHSADSSSSSSEYSSISSSDEYLSPAPEFDGTSVEFLPDHAAHNNYTSEESVKKIVQVARKIGLLIRNPSEIPCNHVLTLHAILTSLTGSVKSKQLQLATDKLYYSRKEASQEDYWSWQAFRDAVAQSGTGPALITMSSWIRSGKVKGNEAAQVIAVVPQAARYPTTEYMNYFFTLVKHKEVRNQKYLNDSAILSFADLIRRSQVDKETSHHRYPIHLSRAQSKNNRAVVTEIYIPYFQSQLENALAKGDSVKIQVYIHALANTAHPKVFSVFEPYLEGKRAISKFQRFLMIATLDEIAKVHPITARSVLYKTYQNQGEAPEVRVAAVMQLMKTSPPAQLLQKMAERTNYDHSKQVNAAVKSAIESLARAKYNSNPYLIENAKSAVNFLTSENYGAQYSKNFILSYLIKEQVNLQYQVYLSSIQAQYGAFPNGLVYNLDRNIGGYITEPFKFSYLTSGSEQLFNLLTKQIQKAFHQQEANHSTRAHPRHEAGGYTYQSISDLIDWEGDEQPQVEGNFFMTLLGGQRLFTFDNHTIEQLPNMISEFSKNLKTGINLQVAKFYNLYSMEVGFPLVTGVPFAYSLNVPTLSYFKVKGNGHFGSQHSSHVSPLSAAINGQYEVILSSQRRGKLGFSAPYCSKKYLASVEKLTQFYLPLRGKIEFNGTKNQVHTSLQPASENLLKIFQYNTSVFTTYHNVNDDTPYLQGSNARLVSVRPNKIYHTSFGKEFTGYAFQVDINSEGDFHDSASVYNAFYKNNHDLISFMLYSDLETVIVNNNFVISYDPKSGTPKETTIAVSYMQKATGNMNRTKRVSSKGTDNKAQPISLKSRKEDLLRNVDIGIHDAISWLVDASISFGGSKRNGQHVLTFAHAGSPVSKKSRYLIYYHGAPVAEDPKELQAAVQISVNKPQLPLLNYIDALNADGTMYVEGKVNFDESEDSTLEFQGKLQKTAERKEYLREHPFTAVCEKQMTQGDYIQPACLILIESANYLDKYDFSVNYQNLPTTVKSIGYSLYGLARHFGNQYHNESRVKGEDGKLKFEVKFTEDLQKVNVSMKTSILQSNFDDVHINYWIHPLLVQHPRSSQVDMFSRKFVYTDIYPICSLDPGRVSTFNQRSYPTSLGDCFHVMAMSVPRENDTAQEFLQNTQNFTVLVKDNGSQGKIIQLLLGDDTVTLKPSEDARVSIQANYENIQFSESRLTTWKNGPNEFVVYSLPGDYVVLYSGSHGLKLIYDGQRVQLAISTHYRNKVRGLCGTFDGEDINDFMTPSHCILKDRQQLTASYAVPDDTCQGSAKYLHIQARDAPCYPKKIMFINVVNENEIQRENRTTKGSERHQSLISCLSYSVKIVKDGQNTCFSIRPQLSCSPRCKATNNIEKVVDFYCEADSIAITHWVNMINKGLYPNFSQKKTNHKRKIPVPDNCIPY